MDEERKWLLEIEATLVKMHIENLEMRSEGFRTQHKLSWTEFERTDSSTERGATVDGAIKQLCLLERNDS